MFSSYNPGDWEYRMRYSDGNVVAIVPFNVKEEAERETTLIIQSMREDEMRKKRDAEERAKKFEVEHEKYLKLEKNRLDEYCIAVSTYLQKQLKRLPEESDKYKKLFDIYSDLLDKINEISNSELHDMVSNIRKIVSVHQDKFTTIKGFVRLNFFREPQGLQDLEDQFRNDNTLKSSKFNHY